ncbi:MAG: toxic anion resistance protein [Clostridiales bacterium]|nr:toxic anion resistance protein [Clostridiales bacterium]
MAFDLSLPSEEEIKQEVVVMTTPTSEEITAVKDRAGIQAQNVMNLDLDSSKDRMECVRAFDEFGAGIMQTSNTKNTILQKRLANYGAQDSQTAAVAKGLEDLTIKMKDLDPSGIDFIKHGPFGKLFNPVRRYFEKYKTADQEIADIIKSLDKGKAMLVNDNTTLAIEQGNMRDTTKKLNQTIEMGLALDENLSAQVENAKLRGTDPEKVKFVEEELLYPLRQRIQDFQQLLIVDQQGVAAMEIVIRNNKELIRSVERAKTVTVSSLRVAVTVAGALYNQKIVLEKVNALNAATNQMISATSKMLKDQGTEIQRGASEASISAETLKQSFADTIQALNDISNYKQEALPRMRASIEEFRELADAGEQMISRLERGTAQTGEFYA